MDFSKLRAELTERYTTLGMRIHVDGPMMATIEAPWTGFGAIIIIDDDDEITVHCGVFTHVHFGGYVDEEPSRADQIRKDVIAFLDAIFSDQVVFFKTRWFGGHSPFGKQEKRRWWGTRKFTIRGVWSGPLD